MAFLDFVIAVFLVFLILLLVLIFLELPWYKLHWRKAGARPHKVYQTSKKSQFSVSQPKGNC